MQTEFGKIKATALRRTALGQQAALETHPADLSANERHVLLMVTGFTPIKHLASLAPNVVEPSAAARLVERGLLEPEDELRDQALSHHLRLHP